MTVLQTRSDLGEALRPPKMLSFKGFASDWTICLDHGQVSTPFLVSVKNIVQATSRKREGWGTAVHGHFIAKNNKSLRQRGAIERFQPTGLSTKFPLLPEILKVQQIPPSCTQVLMGRFPLLIPNLEHYRLTWCLISSWNNLTWSNWKIPSLGATQLTWWENGTWASATRSSSPPGACIG